MWLAALPDLDRPVELPGQRLLRPFGAGAAFRLLPGGLALDIRPDGRPDFRLQLFRPVVPGVPPEPYGVLDLRLRPAFDTEAALAAARAIDPRARVEPVPVTGSVLRFEPQGELGRPTGQLAEALVLAGDGLGGARYTRRLPLDVALFVRSLLEDDALPLLAHCDLRIAGVAPRLPVTVHFDPAVLALRLADAFPGVSAVARLELAARLQDDPAAFGLALAAPAASGQAPPGFGEAMADRLRLRGAPGGPSSGEPSSGDPAAGDAVALPEASSAAPGRFTWDLAEPVAAWRPLTLSFDPFAAVREAVGAAGLEALVPPTAVVPLLPTGLLTLEVSANLPAHRPAVLAAGVTVELPPRLPWRPQAVVATAELEPPGDLAALDLRLAPGEAAAWRASTFVVLDTADGPRQLEGPLREGSGTRLRLGPEDFPVALLPVEASADLLALAQVEVRCRWDGGETAVVLGPALPRALLAVAWDAPEPRLEAEARPSGPGEVRRLGPLPLAPLSLGLPSFPEHGPHRVAVVGDLGDATPLLALELQGEAEEESGRTGVVVLTPEAPRREWRYLAASPFRARYRWRFHAGGRAAPSPWSPWRAPHEPLAVAAEQRAGNEIPGTGA